MITSLDVMLWGKKVGTLIAKNEGYSRRILFYFDCEYVKGGYDIAPIRVPLSSVSVQRNMPIYPEDNKLYGGLPSFVADSLPDHWGNTVFAEWIKMQGIKMRNITQLDRLAYIGSRGMGALEFVPSISQDLEMPFKIEIDSLHTLAQQALSEAKNLHSNLSHDFAVESLVKVGTSAGGRRPKAVINANFSTGEYYSGQVITPIDGFIPMIVKFDEYLDLPTTRIEYSYYLMALAVGMHMMPSRLIECNGSVHFATQRFDRSESYEKVHVQTLAALNPGANDYESLFHTAFQLGIAVSEMQQIFINMVMNIVCGNVDDHNKNFSFLMGRDGVWHYAPAYDFTFSVDVSAPNYVNGHSMSLCGKTSDFTLADLMSIASRYGIKGAEGIVEKCVAVASDYATYAVQADIPERWTMAISDEIAQRVAGL